MNPFALKMKCALALVIGGILAAGQVMADRDGRSDRRDGQRGERRDDDGRSRRDRDGRSERRRDHFEDRHRVIVHEFFVEEFRGGRCPPGLRKKHNGCMPPGQVRLWQFGRPLPRDVIFFEVPQPLLVQIGAPPPGHRYVRVASDILLIALGSGIVVDAIQDLGR